MWDFLRTLIAKLPSHRPFRQRLETRPATDWLPPVLGPQDWQIALLADRDSAWYFERDRT